MFDILFSNHTSLIKQGFDPLYILFLINQFAHRASKITRYIFFMPEKIYDFPTGFSPIGNRLRNIINVSYELPKIKLNITLDLEKWPCFIKLQILLIGSLNILRYCSLQLLLSLTYSLNLLKNSTYKRIYGNLFMSF